MTRRSVLLGAVSVAAVTASVFTAVGSAAAGAPATRFTVSATAYRDVNANGRFDAGEALRGGRITVFTSNGKTSYKAVTGARGKFVLRVPKGSYWLSGSGSGWVVIPRAFTVKHFTPLSLRAVRPLGNVLKATLQFDQDRYAPGETAHITATLTNTGATTLRRIAPSCNRAGNPNDLDAGSSWGALAGDKGVTLAPHTTRVFRVTNTVPAVAQRAGVVGIACDFGYPGVEQGNRPTAHDDAKVPGQSGAMAANVYYRSGGKVHGLAKVRVVLFDPTSCPVFTRSATTDKAGNVRIANAPAGQSYQVYLYPPAGWKAAFDNPMRGLIFGKDTARFGFEVKRGTAHVPTPPTKCASASR